MQIITKKENNILDLIKTLRQNNPESLSYEVLKEHVDISETRMVESLEILEKKQFIRLDDDNKIIYYTDLNAEVKVVENKSALKKYMLNKTEEDAYEIIRDVITKYEGYAPRYVLEGALLYGQLELTPKRTYNIIVSLENKKLLNKVVKNDGEYYTI